MIATQVSHLLHGFGVGPFSQLRALARMRAVDVFPVPREPLKRYACPIRSSRIPDWIVSVTCS